MKKFLLLIALWSLNIMGMEISQDESNLEETSYIDTIPDEILMVVFEQGLLSSLVNQVNMEEDLRPNLGEVFKFVSNFFGNVELVNIRFRRCIQSLVKYLALLELNKDYFIGEPWIILEDLLPAHRIIPFAKKLCMNTCLEKYIEICERKGLFFKLNSPSSIENFKYIYGVDDIFVYLKKLNKMILLIKNGADVDCCFERTNYKIKRSRFVNKERKSSLLCIAAQSHKIQNSLYIGCLKKLVDKKDRPVFKMLVLLGQKKAAKSLLNMDNLVDWKDVIRLLLFYGANINLPDSKGRTPFILALENADYDLAKFLLNHKADPTICDKKGKTSLMYALQFCENYQKFAESKLFELLLEHGVDINAKDLKGNNALAAAYSNMHKIPLMNLLIARGIRLNELLDLKWGKKRTALGWAVYHRNIELVKLFLENDANIYVVDNKGKTVFDYCNKKLKLMLMPEILELLKKKDRENKELGGNSFCTLF